MSLHPNDVRLGGGYTQHASVKERLAAAFQRALATSRSPTKELARRLRRTPNGAAMLLRGDVAPSAETLIAACREFDDVWEEVRALCGRANERSDAERMLDELATRLNERRNG